MTSTDENDGQDLVDLASEDRPRLPGRRMRVQHGADEFTVRILNKDRVAWDKTAPKKKWGAAQDVPFLASTFLAFCAMKREGLYTDSFDAFCDWAEDVEDITDEEDNLGADPTKKGPGPGSA